MKFSSLLILTVLLHIPNKGWSQYLAKLSWSADGNKIVFSSDIDGDSEIYAARKDGSELIQLTKNEIFDSSPQWSAYTNEIIFLSGKGKVQIFKMDADGSNKVNLTNSNTEEWQAQLAPDGKRIVFASLRHEFSQLYTMNIDGSNLQRVINSSTALIYPSWGLDNETIVFSEIDAFNPSGNIFSQKFGKLNDSNFQPLFTKTITATAFLDWINTDEFIYHEKYKDQTDPYNLKPPTFRSIVYSYNITNKKRTKVIKKAGNIFSLSMSPTNPNIMVYISGDPPFFYTECSVYLFNREDRKPIKIAEGFKYAEWSPDGSSIALSDDKYILLVNSQGEKIGFLNK